MKSLFLAFVLIVSLSTLLPGQKKLIRNTVKEIDSHEGNIKLSLVRIWGDEDVDDENQFFRCPSDIKVGRDGLIYIVDKGNHRIQMFDMDGRYKKTVGRRGKGPGDVLLPNAVVIDRDNNIVVSDASNHRIQTFDQKGNYVHSFRINNGSPSDIRVNSRNEIIVYSYTKSFSSGYYFTIYNR